MGQITRAELQRAKRLRPNDLTAYDYFQLGKESKATVSNIDQGIEYLTKAVTLDPQLARAYSIRAWLYNFSIMFGADAATGLKQMVADAEKAVALDPQDCELLGTLAFARMYPGPLGGGGGAIPLLRRDVPGQLACPGPGGVPVSHSSARPRKGAGFGDRALRLDPRMTPANLSGVKDAYYMARRYEDTIDAVTRMPEEQRSRDSWVILAASYARLGRTEEAAAAKSQAAAGLPQRIGGADDQRGLRLRTQGGRGLLRRRLPRRGPAGVHD